LSVKPGTRVLIGAVVALTFGASVVIQAQLPAPTLPAEAVPDVESQVDQLMQALIRLPLATGLASLLALRPARRGSPSRDLAVVHTQIILAVVGALVMLVVGASLARAFGIVGAAGLVRYRAKISDPKDAGVMLSTLGIGLATGVGLWMIALFATAFLLALLWTVESFEPSARETLTVTIKSKTASGLKDQVEKTFRSFGASSDVRAIAPEELQYEIRWPAGRPTKALSERLVSLDPSGRLEVEIESGKKD
jgi:Domain of unknown function (DUF4956)